MQIKMDMGFKYAYDNFMKNRSISVVKHMKVWMQCPGQEVPKYQGWERVQREVGFSTRLISYIASSARD